ncbi:MAG TPA: hypothetical protein VF932_08985 [Anaerolineae bacterium]
MNRTRLIIMIVLFATLLLITATLVMAANPVIAPNYGTANPDGNEGEWDTRLPTSAPPNRDWVASTCLNGIQPCANPTGDLFLRFDATAPATTGTPNHGTLFVLWVARPGFTYSQDPTNCGSGGGAPCMNSVELVASPAGVKGIFDEDSTKFLNATYPGNDVWRQLTDGKGWEAALIEWSCNTPRTWNLHSSVSSQDSSTGPVDMTFTCTSIDSTHGPTGPAGSITYDSVTIASTFTVNPTGTVTWYYCYNSATTTPPSATFPNGCMPNVAGFVPTSIGQTTLKLYKPPSPVQVAWNTSRGDAIPILPGPILGPLGAFTPVSTLTYQSPNFIPSQMGTYCYYADYAPSATAATAGYTAMAHTNNSTQCFIISLPTAVSISSMTAQAGWPGANLPLLVGLWAGVVAIMGAGVVGIGKLLRKF